MCSDSVPLCTVNYNTATALPNSSLQLLSPTMHCACVAKNSISNSIPSRQWQPHQRAAVVTSLMMSLTSLWCVAAAGLGEQSSPPGMQAGIGILWCSATVQMLHNCHIVAMCFGWGIWQHTNLLGVDWLKKRYFIWFMLLACYVQE